ncbi:MAG: hypothetical protein US36_C0019G0012 [Candidatus Wolfebacteria bacterium GW2011_GWC1_37_10]|uniref:Uncharacterized protein n=1 Tax=Candidatus Wolfebacteria bacterium GW2011_GWC1_37_10 TaxID=1619010 RepID=A0A0G0IZV8_9BACT|nr:MAG: hypothetical protein US36_C0019G0012 [Candidatus Wolfebacteria bacterium GW2011_GWC1_37_10]
MNRLKIAAIVLVMVSGLAGSYFIVKNSTPSLLSEKKLMENSGKSGISSQSPIEWVKNLVSGDYSQSIGDSNNDLNNAKNGFNKETANLTETVAQSLFGKMKTMDQSGNDPFGNFDINNSENQKLVDEALVNLKNQFSLDFDLNEEDLKISADNSLNNKARYLEETGKIILKNADDFYNNPAKAVESAVDMGNVSGVKNLADTYQNIYSEFLNTSVPSDWLDLHKRYLEILKKSELIYRDLTDIQNDPIKAAVLIQILPEIVVKETEIKKEYYWKSMEINS